jgi:hypothetical protein
VLIYSIAKGQISTLKFRYLQQLFQLPNAYVLPETTADTITFKVTFIYNIIKFCYQMLKITHTKGLEASD